MTIAALVWTFACHVTFARRFWTFRTFWASCAAFFEPVVGGNANVEDAVLEPHDTSDAVLTMTIYLTYVAVPPQDWVPGNWFLGPKSVSEDYCLCRESPCKISVGAETVLGTESQVQVVFVVLLTFNILLAILIDGFEDAKDLHEKRQGFFKQKKSQIKELLQMLDNMFVVNITVPPSPRHLTL